MSKGLGTPKSITPKDLISGKMVRFPDYEIESLNTVRDAITYFRRYARKEGLLRI